MRRVLAVALTLVLLGAALPALAENIVYKGLPLAGPDVQWAPDRFVVRFKPEVGELTSTVSKMAHPNMAASARNELRSLEVAFAVRQIDPLFPGANEKHIARLEGYHRVTIGAGRSLDEAMAAYSASPLVDEVQPIGIHPVYAVPNDPYYDDPTIFPSYYQWGMNNAGDHDVDAAEAWDLETGDSTVIIAILDTGVKYFHTDLGGPNGSYANPTGAVNGNIWINWAEKNGTTGVDDDGNGYVDDWVGYDFVNGATPCWSGEDCNTIDNDPRDFNGHGTHCSGIAAAITNNGRAVSGMAGGFSNGTTSGYGNGSKVMCCRIGWSGSYLGQEVGYVGMDFAASALYYAANKGARVASGSWGSSNSGGLAAAMDYFEAAGGIFCHAAGNSNNQTADYLGSRTSIVNVAATDSLDHKASFSSYGSWVDVSAPGVAIISTYHVHSDPSPDYVAVLDGTSMATPYVAGVCGLIRSAFPSYTRQQVFDRLTSTCDNINALNPSYSGLLGAGRVNAFKAVQGAGPVPPVAAFVGSPTSGCAPLTVNFTDQSTGSPTSWAWNFGDGGTSTAQNPSHPYASAGSYTVTLTATNAQGSDPEVKTNYITVTTGAPVANFVGAPTSGAAPLVVSFTDQSTGGPTSWSWNFGDAGTSTAQNPSHTYASAGTYTVTLTATNGCGSDGETKTGYITVSAPAQQCDDFADGSISNWGNSSGTWSVVSGAMKGNSATTNARRTSPFGTFSSATIDCDVRINAARQDREGRIIWAYTNSSNYRYVVGDDDNNRWQIVERTGGTNTVRATFSTAVNAAQWYHVKVTVAASGAATLYVGGTPILSYSFASSVTGQVGCGYSRANVDFDNFCVGAGVVLGEEVAPPVIVNSNGTVPRTYALDQNYPNPFNAGTVIPFSMDQDGDAQLVVYDILGRTVRHLIAGFYATGPHSVPFDGRDDNGNTLASGVYLYRLVAPGVVETRKMMLIK